MIWYLLCWVRGTTEPPQLSSSHPIRRAFQAHGTATAQRWLLSILLTIVISVLLCYPAVFQTDSPAAAGLRNLPKHVWTSMTEVEGDRPADVEVRQVWVHGDYMNAIDRRVLREAMRVQDALIADGFDDDGTALGGQHSATRIGKECVATSAGQKWGFHSPLMYWNCSLDALEEDQHLLSTINSHSEVQSALNLTLRPSTVFAGKAFAKTKLRSADALVITLFDQTNSGLGATWDARSQKLARELPPDWSLFPEDGRIFKSRLYEFRFKPMTLNDDLFLAASYMVTAGYVIWRMMQLRAVKSWFGLLITICAKMTICVIGSFTICTYLGINLARIPRPWFPAVVFCFGLGNIFRLINVVLETPPEMPPQQRIGHAIGQVGHLSLAVAGQNLLLIWVCSRLVTPWVADFCVFAAVTLVLDLVFHLTFFLAVLSVDVQRMELSDSLGRIESSHLTKNTRPERQSWLSALRQGNLPFSTRFAGSVAILSIILAINWHFFDTDSRQLSIQDFKNKLFKRQRRFKKSALWSAPPINQARTPADWLRIQDHNTARELIGFIKPSAHSFVAKIYDPLLVVLKGANGRDTSQKSSSIVDVLRHFARNHAFPAALVVVFLIAGVTLLMNYLLWTGLPEGFGEEEEDDAMFSVKTLPTSQTLDIVRLASSPKGHIVSISLDRTTSIWLHGSTGFSQTTLQTAAMKPKLWPITACAISDGGSMLAFCTDEGYVGFWSLAASRLSSLQTVDLRGQAPILFTLATILGSEHDTFVLLIVTADGYFTQVETRDGMVHTRRISSSPVQCAKLYPCAKDDLNLVFVNRSGEVHILAIDDERDSTSEVVAGLDPGPPPGSNPSKIRCIEAVPTLGLIFALRDEEAEIFDFNSRALVHAFPIGHVKPHSFRVMHSTPRQCTCGAPSVHSLCIAYTEEGTEHMIMQTFTLDDTPTSLMCLGKPSDHETQRCQGLVLAKDAVHYVEPAGIWESTSVLGVIGIRRSNPSPTPSSSASGVDYTSPEPSSLSTALKQRAAKQSSSSRLLTTLDSAFHTHHPPASPGDMDSWEAWMLSSSGEFRARPLIVDSEDVDEPLLDEQLFVAAVGPITKLGKRSVAVGFGNTVKIVTLGKESFDGSLAGTLNGAIDLSLGTYGSRTRRGPGRKVQ
ncbi:hypothetical protein K458DRAFT_382904 [Lentithecium fluviatile CBS 122367]|uniref:Sterol regulatory element-binding protein cleavage-activating protein n=1 Tax=Lentithecium fluviatile CBS 122367 TaxID=1168545 RepID=A0A6G1JM92_9PLEO|nr:hypothetical protein K458DRAFT_382904 [Lentithecium fluviatile CBS 122367]